MALSPLEQTQEIVSAINDYMRLLDESPDPEALRLTQLAQAIDSLIAEYFRTSDGPIDEQDVDPPREDYDMLYARAGRAFPSLGYYPHVFPGGELDEKASIADAIDDLADIARDLLEVRWLVEKGQFNDAIWQFRFGYHTHWGAHAHGLRAFLHSSKVGAW